ncbi:MAG: GNAT family protein [Chloroflexota bacterium]|nr:GNAT family protein [Chloroflexota bacterium]MDE2920806.1 GNAT family protein [Chloroflexota bacterium]
MSQHRNKPVVLRTARLLLRPFEFTDVDDVCAYASDPEVARFRPLPDPYTREDALGFVNRQIRTNWSRDAEFAIVYGPRVIGGLSLHVNSEHETGELGYLLGRRWWGHGLATEAARAVVDWGFRRFGLHKVYARAHVDNKGSWRVMERLGMTREGVLRGHWKMRDEHVDLVYYAVFRDEWALRADSGADPSAKKAQDVNV